MGKYTVDVNYYNSAVLDAWQETQHPRGQPENKGEFAKTASSGKPAAAATAQKPQAKPAGGNAKLFSPAEVANLPDGKINKVTQPFKSREALQQKSVEGLEQLRTWLDKGAGVAISNGFRDMPTSPTKVTPEEWAKPGGMLFIGGLKAGLDGKPGPDGKPQRAEQKVMEEYGGDWSMLKDTVRCTLATDTNSQLQDIVAKLKKSGGLQLVQQPKDRFENPTPSGYRDVLLSVRLPNGLIAEVQLNTKTMMQAKNKGHKLYEQERLLDPKIKSGTATPEEQKQHAALQKQQTQLYEEAWQRSLKAA